MPADEGQSGKSKRPSITNRHSSTGSISQSLSDASSSAQRAQFKAQRHVVGAAHGRLGARNTSFGKNLNKLSSKQPTQQQHDAPGAAAPTTTTTTTKHMRSRSGELAISSSPGRPSHGVKRNASAFVVPRNSSHTALKKTASSGHLPRHGSSKNIAKHGRHQAPSTKRTRSDRSDKSQKSEPSQPPSSPETAHPTVRFDLGADAEAAGDDDDGAWESTSQSPNTTRTHTRQSSVAGDSIQASREDISAHKSNAPNRNDTPQIEAHPSSQVDSDNVSSKDSPAPEMNGGKAVAYASARPPDPDAITSRLLHRTVSHNADALVSGDTIVVTADTRDIRSLSHSQSSTLADGTPGRDLVSRFINGGSGTGTPHSSFLPGQDQIRSRKTRKVGFDDGKRNKSVPNMTIKDESRSSSPSLGGTPVVSRQRSPGPGPPTPTHDRELPQSRTQQKLLLQRTSSMIEPQKHIPAVLPRPGAPQLLGSGGAPFGLVSGGRLGDPAALPAQIAALFQSAGKEYNVIKRFRAPVVDAVYRVTKLEGGVVGADGADQQQQRWPKAKSKAAVAADGREHKNAQHRASNSRDSTLSVQMHGAQSHGADRQALARQDDRERERGRHRGPERSNTRPNAHLQEREQQQQQQQHQRAKVSFDLPSSAPFDHEHAAGGEAASFGSVSDGVGGGGLPMRDEAYEICRRLWDDGLGQDDGVVVQTSA